MPHIRFQRYAPSPKPSNEIPLTLTERRSLPHSAQDLYEKNAPSENARLQLRAAPQGLLVLPDLKTRPELRPRDIIVPTLIVGTGFASGVGIGALVGKVVLTTAFGGATGATVGACRIYDTVSGNRHCNAEVQLMKALIQSNLDMCREDMSLPTVNLCIESWDGHPLRQSVYPAVRGAHAALSLYLRDLRFNIAKVAAHRSAEAAQDYFEALASGSPDEAARAAWRWAHMSYDDPERREQVAGAASRVLLAAKSNFPV